MNKHFLKSSFALLNADHVQLNLKWNYKNITSIFYRLYLVNDGIGMIFNNRITHELKQGCLYLIPSFTPCSYICEKYLSVYYLSFVEETTDGSSLFANNRTLIKVNASNAHYEQFKRLIQLNPNRGLHQTQDPTIYEKLPILQTFQELNNELSFAAYIETSGIILQLISSFLNQQHFKIAHSNIIPSKIHDTINYIQTNLYTPMTVKELAGRANQNADYFSRLFFESTGERPLKYIQSKRIERAQTLLGATNLPFSEIADITGFDNSAYFSRIFKRVTGITPGEFKRSCTVR